MTLSKRNRRPQANASDTKSSDQRWLVPSGSPSAPACQRPFPAAALAQCRPLLAIQSVHLLEVHALAFALELDRKPATRTNDVQIQANDVVTKVGQRLCQCPQHFNLERHLIDRQTYKERRSADLAEWCQLAGPYCSKTTLHRAENSSP